MDTDFGGKFESDDLFFRALANKLENSIQVEFWASVIV